MIAHDAFEYGDRSIFRRFERRDDFFRWNSFTDNLHDVLEWFGRAAAHGRQKGYFIAGPKPAVPRRIFLVDRAGHRFLKLRERREPFRVAIVDILEAALFRSDERLLRRSDNVFELSKKEHAQNHGLILSRAP